MPVGDCFILIQDDCDLSSVADSSTTGDAPKIVLIQIDDIPNQTPESLNIDVATSPMLSREDSSSPVPDTPTLLSLTEAMSEASGISLLPLTSEREEQTLDLTTRGCESDRLTLLPMDKDERMVCSPSMPLLACDEDTRGSSEESVRVVSD